VVKRAIIGEDTITPHPATPVKQEFSR